MNWSVIARCVFPVGMVAACALPEPDADGGRLVGDECGTSSVPPEIGPWDPSAASFEQRVVELTNELRRTGACCGSNGCFGAAAPLALSENLHVAARLHARDMAERGYFAHESPDGRTSMDRILDAGFGGCAFGENIAQGQTSPEAVVESWRTSDDHCANLLSPTFRSIGVGYAAGSDEGLSDLWVQNFGD